MSGSDRLSPRQRRAVAVVLTSRTAREAATAVGVSERTMRRWQQDAEFSAAVQSEARRAAREAGTLLLAAQRRAVGALLDALDDRSPSVRLRAALALIDAGRYVAADDLDARLAVLEARRPQWPAAV